MTNERIAKKFVLWIFVGAGTFILLLLATLLALVAIQVTVDTITFLR